MELLLSYIDYHLLDPEDFGRSFKLAQSADNFIGIIATAAVIYVVQAYREKTGTTYKISMSIGLTSWGRMWWTRFLSFLAIILGLLLLIVPGIILIIRLSLAETIVVVENRSGVDALKRSWHLTKGHSLTIFLLSLMIFPLIIFLLLLYTPIMVFPEIDHWVLDALISLLGDYLIAFCIIIFSQAYYFFKTETEVTPELES